MCGTCVLGWTLITAPARDHTRSRADLLEGARCPPIFHWPRAPQRCLTVPPLCVPACFSSPASVGTEDPLTRAARRPRERQQSSGTLCVRGASWRSLRGIDAALVDVDHRALRLVRPRSARQAGEERARMHGHHRRGLAGLRREGPAAQVTSRGGEPSSASVISHASSLSHGC